MIDIRVPDHRSLSVYSKTGYDEGLTVLQSCWKTTVTARLRGRQCDRSLHCPSSHQKLKAIWSWRSGSSSHQPVKCFPNFVSLPKPRDRVLHGTQVSALQLVLPWHGSHHDLRSQLFQAIPDDPSNVLIVRSLIWGSLWLRCAEVTELAWCYACLTSHSRRACGIEATMPPARTALQAFPELPDATQRLSAVS